MSEGEKIERCPRCVGGCGKVWVHFDKYDRQQYRTNCECGNAWKKGAWKNTRKEAIEAWNKKAHSK